MTSDPRPAVFEVRRRTQRERVAELWQYRHLVESLVVRDLKVRYKSSVLGFLWSLVGPLLMMAVFWFVFGVLLNQTIRDYPVFLLVALLPWNWFQVSVAGGLHSVTNNAGLINKVYFPRDVLPLSVVLGEGVNFVLALPVLAAVLFATGNPLTVHALWVPVIMLIQLVFTVGIVMGLSTAHVYYRDTAVIMEVVLLAWFFVTPVFYSYPSAAAAASGTALLGGNVSVARIAYILNPMASLVANYRVVLYGSPQGPPTAPAFDFLVRTAITALATLAVGYWIFSRHAGRFGEEV